MFLAGNRCGKSLKNNELVLTPNGFVEIQNLNVGDFVVGANGLPTKVLGVYPQGIRPIYKITFSDGSSVSCDDDHLWSVRNTKDGAKSPFKVLTTKQIRCSSGVFATPQRPAVEFAKSVELPLPAYLIGLLLGDGCLTQKAVMLSTGDQEIVNYCSVVAREYDCQFIHRGRYDYQFVSDVTKRGHVKNWIADILDGLGLRFKSSYNKRIPEAYKYASLQDRIDIVRGLMDSDGTCGENGSRAFYSVNEGLIDDFVFVCRSLGLNPVKTNKITNYKDQPRNSFVAYIPFSELSVFNLPRKKIRERKPISSRPVVMREFEYEGEFEATCIKVEAEDSLFITKDFVVTHNTYTGAVETSFHLTGEYPDWWQGWRFEHPIDAWAASNTTQSTRDALQYTYMGDINLQEPNIGGGRLAYGCGTIPKSAILEYSRARGGANDAIDIVKVRHKSGGVSTLGFKTYEQGRTKFQGTAKHWIHLDEEPPQDIYNECAMRLAGSHINGRLILTMTPLFGMTDVCLKFLEDKNGNFFYTQMGWQDAKHLSDQEKQELLSGMAPHEIEAREKGIPAIGSGRVYTTPEADFVVDPFKTPDNWRYAYGMDFGWKNTAAVFVAYDPDSDVVYITDSYKQGEKEIFYHSSVLKRKGATWMPGVCDPAGQASSQKDGENLIDMYTLDGLNLSKADNAVDSGIMEVYQRLASGRLKVFSNCQDWLAEYRLYARDDKGKIIKKNDHLLDATRYVVASGLSIAKRKPLEKRNDYVFFAEPQNKSPWGV